MPVNQENIRSTIKQLMFRDSIKQTDIANSVGIHKGNISKMVNGFATISPSVIAFFENRYSTKIEQLVAQLARKSEKVEPDVSELNHTIEKLELKISGLENELRRADEALKSKDKAIKSLEAQLEKDGKKRDPTLEDGEHTIPARRH